MHILYIDDEQEARDAFVERFRKGYEKHHVDVTVTCQADARTVAQLLNEKHKLPDVVVMDLYATKAEGDDEDAKATNAEVNRLVGRIEAERKTLEELVALKKTPAGLDALKAIRETPRLRKLPVVLTTREGMALLGDDVLRDSIQLDADWMLKGKGFESESALIHRAFQRQRATRDQRWREIGLTVGGAILGAILGKLFG